MKYTLIFTLLLLGGSLLAQTGENVEKEEVVVRVPPLSTESDSMSYLLGLSLGYDLSGLPFETDLGLILAGLSSAYFKTADLDAETTEAIFSDFQQRMQQRQNYAQYQEMEERLLKGEEFLRENMKRPEVVITSSGLQYEVLVKGEGPMPADTSMVTVHYEGSLLDGSVFDSSYDRGESASFPLNRVISGWTEGLQLMPVGSTYKFYIHPNLGYGPRPSGSIPANSVLIFKVELLAVE